MKDSHIDILSQYKRKMYRRVMYLTLMFIITIFGFLNMFIMQPYDVHDESGACAFVVVPTGWNDEEVTSCGAVRTYDSVPLNAYFR